MTKVTIDTRIAASAEQLWDALRKAGLAWPWNIAVEATGAQIRDDGQTRTVNVPGGASITQRLEHVSDSERVYVCSVSSSQLPVTDCVGKVRIVDNGDGTSTVEWSSNFTPAGAAENDAARAVRSMFEAGVENLRRMFPK